MSEPPRVVYLGGLGRSGTTLLERLLSELPGVVSLGEVVHMWQRGLVDGERCGCGEPFRDCAFWTKVGDVAFGGWDGFDVQRLCRLQASVDRIRHIPALARSRLTPRTHAQVAEYTGYYARLYAAVGEVSGASVVVDSSKHASLAFCLRWAAELDLRVLHVVRDSRAVAYSWTRRVRRPEATTGDREYMAQWSPVATATHWMAENAAFALLGRLGTPTTLVRYEDFVRSPVASLRELAAVVGLPADHDQALGFLTDEHADLTGNHTASGNPMRFQTGRILLRRDDTWRSRLASRDRRTVTALTLPLLWHYRYLSTGGDTQATGSARGPGAGPASVDWPSVGVVLPTHNRPELLRRALSAVLAQHYPGELRAVVVFDRAEPDETVVGDAGDQVRVVANTRTPGLAGARNTGILALDTDLVAFCDDDDVWLPGKLTAQVELLRAHPKAELASCGIVIDFDGRSFERLAGADEVGHDDLIRSRMVMVHSSTYLARRTALIDMGLVDEGIPGGQGEDWDLALRAARRHPIVNVDRPWVRVLWGRTSYFAQAWDTKIAALGWILDRHPEIAESPVGAGRVYGQIAFGHACLGRRGEAWRWALRAARANWRERRVPFALAVASGLVSGERVLRLLHARGRGI